MPAFATNLFAVSDPDPARALDKSTVQPIDPKMIALALVGDQKSASHRRRHRRQQRQPVQGPIQAGILSHIDAKRRPHVK